MGHPPNWADYVPVAQSAFGLDQNTSWSDAPSVGVDAAELEWFLWLIMSYRRQFRRAVMIAIGLFGSAALPICVAQSTGRPANRGSIPQFHARSTLVQIPVFVYSQDRFLWAWESFPEGRDCMDEQDHTFFSLSASQPFIEKACDPDLIQNLAPRDFHLFIDGSERKINNVSHGQDWITVRDNVKAHVESSDTARGFWSSSDFVPTPSASSDPSLLRFRPSGSDYYYILTYVPSDEESGCHRIRVKVDRPGVYIFSRDEYCSGQSADDPLFGSKISNDLNAAIASSEKPKLDLAVQAAEVHAAGTKATADIVLEFPSGELFHRWSPEDWSLYARIAILGIVYADTGVPVGRFSDLLYPSWWPTFIAGKYSQQNSPALQTVVGNEETEADREGDRSATARYLRQWDVIWLPSRYETQLELAPGNYKLKVVLSDGKNFARTEVPLNVDSYDSKQLGISGVILGKRFRHARVAAVETAEANIAPQYVPLVSKDVRLTPAGDTRFSRGDTLIAYFELYERSLTAIKPEADARVQAHLRIVDSNGKIIKDFPGFDVTTYEEPGSAVIPIVREVPFNALPSGAYQLQVQGTDSAGNSTLWRTAAFSIEQR